MLNDKSMINHLFLGLGNLGVGIPGGDSTHVIDGPGEPDVSLVSPAAAPAVLDLPELGGVSSDSHGVVRGPTTVVDGQNSVLVVVEVSLDLECHGHGSLVQGGGQAAVSAGSHRSGELGSGECVGLAAAAAGSGSCSVGVITGGGHVLLGQDVVVGVPVPSSVTPVPARVSTVDELLLREPLQVVGGNGVVSLQGGNTSKSPARSAPSLVLDGSHLALLSQQLGARGGRSPIVIVLVLRGRGSGEGGDVDTVVL